MIKKEIVVETTKEFAIRHGKDFTSRGVKTILFTVLRAFIIPIIITLSMVFAIGFTLGIIIF